MTHEYPCKLLDISGDGKNNKKCRLDLQTGTHCVNPLVRGCREYFPIIEGVI